MSAYLINGVFLLRAKRHLLLENETTLSQALPTRNARTFVSRNRMTEKLVEP